MLNINFTNVTFTYPQASEPIVKNLTISFQAGWTGIIGANGIGKTTLAKLATGNLQPQQGSIQTSDRHQPSSLYCAQSTFEQPDFISDFFSASDNLKGQLCSILKIDPDWGDRWETLSHGERKKLQLAILLWKKPEIIVVDEPTNHLDHSCKMLIIRALKEFQGLGIIISHDRELLDLLCSNCLFLDKAGIAMRPGGISDGLRQKELEDKANEKKYEKSRELYKKLAKAKQQLRQEVSKKEKRNTKKHLDKYDSDGRGKVNLARLTNKDGIGGRKVQQLARRTQQAKQEVSAKVFKKTEIKGFGFKSELFPGNNLLDLREGSLKLSDQRQLIYPALSLAPLAKIGLTGDNGTGKSTLLRYIVSQLKIPPEKYIYVPQEFTTDEVEKILNALHDLNRRELGSLLSITDRLGSSAERILETVQPSHGELRKIWLGLGLLKNPYLIIMDEPTNHLDYPSIVCLEEALQNFQGALLLVSHDLVFIHKLTKLNWHIAETSIKTTVLTKSFF